MELSSTDEMRLALERETVLRSSQQDLTCCIAFCDSLANSVASNRAVFGKPFDPLSFTTEKKVMCVCLGTQICS